MMSKRNWFFVLCLFVAYLLIGAAIFFTIETVEEQKRIELIRQERLHIAELLKHHMNKDTTEKVFRELSNYCGKALHVDMSDIKDEHHWDFYHTLFFVITVVSTIGYGNLAPTTMSTRIILIFYGLIGIPINGIVMVTLGGFFEKSFTKLYQRWKTTKMDRDTTRLGLISQIILYLVPGFTIFIFLPSVIMMMYEGWTYDQAVYYCFVSLTTIGFGDIVAGTSQKGESTVVYLIYKIFLLVWVIGGLGYVVMILGFITKAMQSKKLQKFEQMLKDNIKKTPLRIQQELRGLLQEFLFLRVKRVYKDEFSSINTISKIVRSQSCPDLTIYRNMNSPTMQRRKRAYSECPRTFILNRIQSDTQLDLIDKERTFKPTEAFMQQKDLLLKVVDALGKLDTEPENRGVDMFSDDEILADESYGSSWSLKYGDEKPSKRRRAISDVRVPKSSMTWYGQDAKDYYTKFRQRTLSDPMEKQLSSSNIFSKIKRKIIPSQQKDDKLFDIEGQINFEVPRKRRSQSIFADEFPYSQSNRRRLSALSTRNEYVLEQTSIADFIRALSAVTDEENNVTSPQRKIGNAGISSSSLTPLRTRRTPIRPLQTRRGSLMPSPNLSIKPSRRFSLRPVDEQTLVPPPPPYYSSTNNSSITIPTRRFSRTSNVSSSLAFTSPVQQKLIKRDKD